MLLLLAWSSVTCAEYLDLQRDSNGWTIFTPSTDTDVIYVDSATGDDTTCRSYRTNDAEMGADPFRPIGAILPCATPARAVTISGKGHPDWILFKRGSSFPTGISTNRSGRSTTEPMVIASYGSSGAMPVFRGGFDNDGGNASSQYIAISGLDFYRDTRDPESASYAPVGQATTGIYFFTHPQYNIRSVLIEGCRIRFFLNNVNITPLSSSGNDGITFRRNVVLNAYSNLDGHSQGMLLIQTDGTIIEENVFDHNGWLVQSDGDGVLEEGEASIFNHNIYMTNNKNLSIKNNIFSRGSSNNSKIKYTATGGGVGLLIDNNLYIGGEIAISIGASDEHAIFSAVSPQITRNIWINPGKWNPTNRYFAWFFYNFNFDGGTIAQNMMLHQEDEQTSGHFFNIGYSGRNVTVKENIVYNVKNIQPVSIGDLDDGNPAREGFVFQGNTFDVYNSAIVNAYGATSITPYSFSGNKYNSTKEIDNWFKVGSTMLTNAQWQSATGDNSAFERVSFPDPGRTLETYMQSIGETATIEAFIAKAHAQDRYSWDARFTAEATNAWIKAGFGMGQRSLFRNVRIGEVEP